MREAAFQLCAPSVNIRKVVDHNPDPAVDDLEPEQGWSMTANVGADAGVVGAADGRERLDGHGHDGSGRLRQLPVDQRCARQLRDHRDGGGAARLRQRPVGDEVQLSDAGLPERPAAARLQCARTAGSPASSRTSRSSRARSSTGSRPWPRSTSRSTPTDRTRTRSRDHPIAIGSQVEWSYLVTNTGNVPLSSVAVTDSDLGPITCPATTLAPGAQLTCETTGTAVAGQYANTGTVTANGPSGPITDSDPSHYFGVQAGIDIEKHTNGDDADLPPGPYIPVGGAVNWAVHRPEHRQRRRSSSVAVTDSEARPRRRVPPPTLAPGAQTDLRRPPGTAVAGQYDNVGSVTATSPTGAGAGHRRLALLRRGAGCDRSRSPPTSRTPMSRQGRRSRWAGRSRGRTA